MKKFKIFTAILKNLCKKNRSVTYSCLTAIIIYLIVASYSFNFYNIANRANIAGCIVNFTANNTGKYVITIGGFSVKTKSGIWEDKYYSGYLINPSLSLKFIVALDFGCDLKRQYRIVLHLPSGGEYCYYYPSEDSWTKKIKINLGDVYRFFK
jgi:hypothetical protein